MDLKIARIVISEALGNLSFAKFVEGGRQNFLLKAFGYATYVLVLETLLARFAQPLASLDATPIQLALDKGLPNNGEHWTDWVPDKIKIRIALIFEALPHKTRAKRKVPFQRLTTPEQNAKARDKLLARTRKEIETLERKQEMNPTEVGQATLGRMREALKVINRLTDTEHIPATWGSVL